MMDTHPAAASMPNFDTTPHARVTTKPRRKPQRTHAPIARCTQESPCGDRCCLNSHITHTLHVCNDTNCDYCHGAERYGKVTR